MRQFVIWSIGLLAAWFLNASVLKAQDQAAEAVRGVEKFNISAGGAGLYRPEKWGMVTLSLRNPQDKDVELLAATHFAQDPTLQFCRRLWMPPQSRMTSWQPIRMPALTSPEQNFFELQTLVMSTAGGVETLAVNDLGAMQFDHSIRVSSSEPISTVVFPLGMIPTQQSLWANAVDLFLTARHERGMPHNLHIMGNELAPAGEEGLDAVEQMVIASDRILKDSAGVGAIRRWVAGGGSLWVMADQVSPEVLQSLLGDECALTVVDRVGLTHVHLLSATDPPTSPPFERDLDKPVDLMRVVVENVDTRLVVNGWPAAFWKSCGEGRILVTTLGPDGWMRPRRREDPAPVAGENFKTGFFPSEPLGILAAEFFQKRPAPRLQPQVAEEQVRQMIGYTIPSRGMILGTLLGFTIAMGGGAILLARRGRLEWLGIATPLAAMVAAAVLLSTGLSAQSEVADTQAAVQWVQAVPGTDDVHVVGVKGVFSKGDENAPLLAGFSGWALPEMSGIEGSTRRLVWNDIDRWSWEKLPQKPGLRTIQTFASGQASKPLAAVAQFRDGKLTGRITLPEGLKPTDAILATHQGRIGLQISEQGEWSAQNDGELGKGQFVAVSVLSDEQQRRSQILADLLKFDSTRPMPPVPTLFVWTKPWDSPAGNSSAGGTSGPETLGSALVSVPVSWLPSAVGAEMTIPRSLVTFREITGPDGLRPSGYFDVRSGQWVERTRSTSGWFEFQVPPSLLPLRTKRVDFRFQVLGAMGRLELFGVKDGQPVSIQVWEKPVGTVTCQVDGDDLLPIDQQGRMIFRLDAGQPSDETSTSSLSLGNSLPFGASGGGALSGATEIDPATYWQFEDISVRMTVEVPAAESSTAAVSSP